MSATWRKVLTDADLAPNTGDVGASVANGQEGLVTGNSVFDYIAAQNFGSGAGDIQSVNQGNGIETSATAGGTAGNIGSGDAFIRVKAAANGGIDVASGGVGLASTLAGDGLALSSGIMTVDLATGSGLEFNSSKLAAKLDANTLHVDNSSGGIDIKNGGVQLVHLDPDMVFTTVDSSNTSLSFTDDTKILTASAINDNFPNVTTAVGAETYVTMGANQVLSVNEIDISANTNLDTAAATAAQGNVVISLTNSTLSANAVNLGTDDAVSFAGVTSTAQLSVTAGGAAITGSTAINGNLSVQGNFSVTGTTTTVNSETVTIKDHVVTLATQDTTPSVTDATESGLDVFTSSTEAYRPRFAWRHGQVSELTGWQIKNHNGSASSTTDGLVDIAVIDFNAGSPTSGAQSTDTSAGVGAFWFDSGTKDLYLRVS